MIIVFDLDDTLYDELTYVESGFRAVACFMHDQLSIPVREVLNFMLGELKKGRGHIFDDALKKFGKYSRVNVKKALSIYRSHKPEIHLYPEAENCLKRLQKFPLYIVTDGNKNVQANKIKSLNLEKMVKKVFITYRHGREKSKPSPYCFQKIASMEKVSPGEVVYIGDNPTKDFVGIKPHGFKTIRVLTGQYKDLVISDKHEADISIKSLKFLNDNLMKKLENNETN